MYNEISMQTQVSSFVLSVWYIDSTSQQLMGGLARIDAHHLYIRI